jgi:dephospho-CoA kinase
MIVVGLTGGIASGKSTISEILKGYGIPVIDSDLISREIMKRESLALNSIKNEFGNDIIDENGELNRKKLASIVFEDALKLESLNSITLPIIKEEIRKKLDCYKADGCKLCVVDAAILIEAKFTDLVNYIILVYVDSKVQLERLMKRDNFSSEEAHHRINSQMTFEKKSKYADFIIDNSRDIEYTKQQVNKILKEIALSEEIDV